MSVTRKWSLLAAVLVLAILAAGWFLLIAPKRTEASGLREQTGTQQEANDRLVQQLEVLKAQQADLPKERAKLAVFRTQIPNNPALPTLIRDLTAAGRKTGVSLDTMTPSLPVPVAIAVPVVPVAPVAPTTESDTTPDGSTGTAADGSTETAADGTTTDGTAGTGTDVAAAVPAAPPASTLFQVPLTLNVTGSYFELEQFINKLEGLKRSYLVSGFTVTPLGDAASATGEPGAPAAGDLTLTLQGRVFLSPPPAVAPVTTPIVAAPAVAAQ